MSDFATQGGHWYLPSGEPFYTIARADGKGDRPVTLRDARKVGALPSVTGIIRCAAAPQLEKWKRNQLLLAALTLPRKPDEPEPDWLVRVERDWQEEGKAAAERGTALHAAVEKHYRGEMAAPDFSPWLTEVDYTIGAGCGIRQWSAERSFACALGYGGKTDLHSDDWVVDVKGKEGDVRGQKMALYDEHLMQLAAYRYGLGIATARAGILFVGRDVPSAVLIEADAEQLALGWEMFRALLAYWQAKNKYRPSVMKEAA